MSNIKLRPHLNADGKNIGYRITRGGKTFYLGTNLKMATQIATEITRAWEVMKPYKDQNQMHWHKFPEYEAERIEDCIRWQYPYKFYDRIFLACPNRTPIAVWSDRSLNEHDVRNPNYNPLNPASVPFYKKGYRITKYGVEFQLGKGGDWGWTDTDYLAYTLAREIDMVYLMVKFGYTQDKNMYSFFRESFIKLALKKYRHYGYYDGSLTLFA